MKTITHIGDLIAQKGVIYDFAANHLAMQSAIADAQAAIATAIEKLK